MWSPLLVPKPKDWGDHLEVVGTFFEPLGEEDPCESHSAAAEVHKEGMTEVDRTADSDLTTEKETSSQPQIQPQRPAFDPPEPLQAFLAAGPAPVFVGFGSMVCADPVALLRIVLQVRRDISIVLLQ